MDKWIDVRYIIYAICKNFMMKIKLFLCRGHKLTVTDSDMEIGRQQLTEPVRAYTTLPDIFATKYESSTPISLKGEVSRVSSKNFFY